MRFRVVEKARSCVTQQPVTDPSRCPCTMCVPGARRGQKRVLDPLGMEPTDGCVGAGN